MNINLDSPEYEINQEVVKQLDQAVNGSEESCPLDTTVHHGENHLEYNGEDKGIEIDLGPELREEFERIVKLEQSSTDEEVKGHGDLEVSVEKQ